MTGATEAALKACRAAVDEARRESANAAEAARQAADRLAAAHIELNAARIAHDNTLPQCDLVTVSSRDPDTIARAVIERRTEKQVYVRRVGTEVTVAYRIDERGQWREYPKSRARWSRIHTTLRNLPELQKKGAR